MFKKRGKMQEQQNEQMDQTATRDSSAQLTEEQLAQSLNTDENRAGIEGVDDMAIDDGDSRLQKELAEAKDKYLRLAAEFENYKRRTSRERIELIQTAGRDIIQSLLEVVDDTDRAISNLDKANDVVQVKEGVMLVFNKLKATLQSKGLKRMEAQGADFDPELHEAITEIPAGDPSMSGKVMDVITPGYYLNDKLIRHAKVIVGK
jgi:molecular chaperone GrpE